MNGIEQRNLGTSELVVPAMGIGTGAWGENRLGYGKSYGREDVLQAYHACLDAGLNFFDTAGSTPLRRRVLSRPRVLQRAKLEPLFAVLEEIAKANDKTISQVALNWLMTNDPLVVPIPGAKKVQQAHENAGALGWHLTEEERALINQAETASR